MTTSLLHPFSGPKRVSLIEVMGETMSGVVAKIDEAASVAIELRDELWTLRQKDISPWPTWSRSVLHVQVSARDDDSCHSAWLVFEAIQSLRYVLHAGLLARKCEGESRGMLTDW